MFTTQQAYLEHHVTLLLATLIHRPHNRNAISRSPSGVPGCTMRSEPRNRFLAPARPNRLHHLTRLLLTWRALVQRLLRSSHARNSSATTPQHGCSGNCPQAVGTPATRPWLGWARRMQSPPPWGQRQLGDTVTTFIIQENSLHQSRNMPLLLSYVMLTSYSNPHT